MGGLENFSYICIRRDEAPVAPCAEPPDRIGPLRHSDGAEAEMKSRRFISLLLLAAYLFATAGSAVLAVTCKCVAMRARSEQHLCCTHCQLPSHTQPADSDLRAPCCNFHHSTEIALYTSSFSDDSEKYVRCAVSELPPSMAAECPCPAHIPALRRCSAPRPDPVPLEGVREAVGLRAPPVLA